MRNILQDLDSGLIFILDMFSDLYDLVHEYQIIMLCFFMPFAVYLFILFLDFFMDVSVIHYDKKVSFYDFKQNYKAVKRKKTEYKKLYDNPNLSVGEKSQKLQNELIKKSKQKSYLEKQSAKYIKDTYISDIMAQLENVPDDLKPAVAEKVYNSRINRLAKNYGRDVHMKYHNSDDLEIDDTDEI